MAANKLIQKLKQSLKKGDQKEIATMAGVTQMTVNRFLNGQEYAVSDQTAVKILDAAAEVIRENKKKASQKNTKLTRLTSKKS